MAHIHWTWNSPTPYYLVNSIMLEQRLVQQGRGFFGPFPQQNHTLSNIYIKVTYTRTSEINPTIKVFESPPNIAFRDVITFNIVDADPYKPFYINELSLDIEFAGNEQQYSWSAAPTLSLVINGSTDNNWAKDTTIVGSINQYAILLGTACGPIEGLSRVKVGSTDVFSSGEDIPGLSNVSVGWTAGIPNKDIEYNIAALDDIPANFEAVTIFDGPYTASRRVAVDNRLTIGSSNQIVYISNYDDLVLAELINRINYTYTLSGTTALNYRGRNNAIYYPIEPLIFNSMDNTFYATQATIFVVFSGGLYAIDEEDGDSITTSFNYAIAYCDENQDELTTAHDYVPMSKLILSKGWKTDLDNAGETNYWKYAIGAKNKSGLRIPIHLDFTKIGAGNRQNIKFIKLWRVDDDAFGGNPTYDDVTNEKKISSAESLKYQLAFDNLDMTYGGTALLAVNTTANSGLNNYFPAITADVYGKQVEWIPNCRPNETKLNYMMVYSDDYGPNNSWDPGLYGTLNETNWKPGFTSNPVWCLLDLLLGKEDGAGNYITEDSIDLESFFIAAKWCDDPIKYGNIIAKNLDNTTEFLGEEYLPRYSLNLTVEMNMPVYSIIQAILMAFRGVLFWKDGKYVLKVDKAEGVSQVLNDTQLADIVINVTSQHKLPNAFTFQYNNIEDNFTQTTMYIEDTDNIIVSDGQVRTKEVVLAGVTNKWQATSIAKQHMYMNKNITKNMSFTAPIDILSADIWDVVRVHTQKFLNKATYSAKIESITQVPGPGNETKYTIKLKTPIMLFSNNNQIPAIVHSWAIQSYKNGTIAVYPPPAAGHTISFESNTSKDELIDTFIINYTQDTSLHTKIQDNDVFTIFGNSDAYDDWRIIGYRINTTKNTVNVMCVNYVDYYTDLDIYELPKEWMIEDTTPRLKLGSSFNINEINAATVKFRIDPKFDDLNRILKINLFISIPPLEDNLQDMYNIAILGSLNDGQFRTLASVLYPSSTVFEIPGMDLGAWKFQFIVGDKFGKVHTSRIISYTISKDNLFEDTINTGGLLDPLIRDACEPDAYDFRDEYIRIKWTNIPAVITAIDVEYTDGISTAGRSYQVVPDVNGDFFIEQLVYDLTEITNNRNSTHYSLYITFWDIFGNMWPEDKNLSLYLVANPPPTQPPVGLFSYKNSYHTITVYPVQSLVRSYINSVHDFAGFTIFVGADAVANEDFSLSDPTTYVELANPILGTINYSGSIIIVREIDYDPDTQAVGITVFDLKDIMGDNNMLLVNLWVIATDIFGQNSQPTNLGQVELVRLENVVNTELIPAAIGDTLSTNLIKNSSFEGWIT